MTETHAWNLNAEDELFVLRAIESAVATILRRRQLPEAQREGWYKAFGKEPGEMILRLEVTRP